VARVALWVVPLAVLTTGTAGCDSFHVTQQIARIRVSETDSGRPAGGAQIEWESKYYKGWMSNLSESERNDLWLSRTMNDPYVTEDDGVASLPTNIGTVVGGLVHEPFNPQEDRLTGQFYLFRVRQGDASETLEVRMVPGDGARGRIFQIAVLSIGPAKEITREYTARGHTNGASASSPATGTPSR
jgi:hypothetical protein